MILYTHISISSHHWNPQGIHRPSVALVIEFNDTVHERNLQRGPANVPVPLKPSITRLSFRSTSQTIMKIWCPKQDYLEQLDKFYANHLIARLIEYALEACMQFLWNVKIISSELLCDYSDRPPSKRLIPNFGPKLFGVDLCT